MLFPLTALGFLNQKAFLREFPLWLSGLRTQHSVREGAGSSPGLPGSVDERSGVATNCITGPGLALLWR